MANAILTEMCKCAVQCIFQLNVANDEVEKIVLILITKCTSDCFEIVL